MNVLCGLGRGVSLALWLLEFVDGDVAFLAWLGTLSFYVFDLALIQATGNSDGAVLSLGLDYVAIDQLPPFLRASIASC